MHLRVLDGDQVFCGKTDFQKEGTRHYIYGAVSSEAVMQYDTRPLPIGTSYNNGVRRHPRTIFSVPITVHFLVDGRAHSSHGITLDISEGGMGALIQAGLQVGETIQIDLPLPGHFLTVVAVVRHCSKLRSGFEFVGLTPEERGQITAASSLLFSGSSESGIGSS